MIVPSLLSARIGRFSIQSRCFFFVSSIFDNMRCTHAEPHPSGLRLLVPQRESLKFSTETGRRQSRNGLREPDAQQAGDQGRQRIGHGQLHL